MSKKMERPCSSQTNSSDYYDDDDSSFLHALAEATLPGDVPQEDEVKPPIQHESQELEPPPPTQPSSKRKRLEAYVERERSRSAQPQTLDDHDDIYGQSHFGDWGEYMQRKRAKLQVQNDEIAGDGNGLFGGLSIYINGYTQPSVQDLRRLIVKHGGVFQPYLDRKSIVTHIITCSLTAAKMREFKHMKVVRPEWLIESAEQNVLLPWRNYVFVQNEKSENAQGTKPKQSNLLQVDRPNTGGLKSTSVGQTRTSLPATPQKRKRTMSDIANAQPNKRHSHLYPKAAKKYTNSSPKIIGQPAVAPFTPLKTSRQGQPAISTVTPVKNKLSPTYARVRKDNSPAVVTASKPFSTNIERLIPKNTDNTLTSPHHVGDSTITSNLSPPKYAAYKSNPIAARVMANPKWRESHTSAAPNYVNEFYKNSRLHHLSSWKAELKNLVVDAQARAEATNLKGELVGRIESEVVARDDGDSGECIPADGVSMRGAELGIAKFSAKHKGKGKEKAVDDRVIMHCDFDCFFVSAGLLTRPKLKGKPVVVCHSQSAQGGEISTSEIASASYEAREYGIRNGMSLRQARELCPSVLTIPYEFERYKQLSLKFYTVLMSHADDLQAVSVDEALIDVTSVVTQLRLGSQGDVIDPAKDFAENIRAQVRNATGCEVSVGISHNILLARLATRRAKPAGSYHLAPDDVQTFLAPLSISDLHGFGMSSKHKAQEKLGTAVLGELMDKSKAVLCEALGKATGETLYNSLRGIDEKQLESDKPRKSVSCEINYGIRFENKEQAEAFIYQMAKEVSKRLDDIGMLGRSITLKIMKRDITAPVEPPKFLGHGACDLYNKQITLVGPGGRATSDEHVIGEHANRILRSFNFDPKELRGLGIQIQRLEKLSRQTGAQQGLLEFRRIVASKNVAERPKAVEKPHSNTASPVKGGLSPKEPHVDLPAFSQVDMEVFNALPEELQKELEAGYKQRADPSVTAQHSKSINQPTKVVSTRQPVRNGGIAQQQNHRGRRPGVNALESSRWLLNILKKRKKEKAGASKLSDKALKELNIDVDVFRNLPPALQHEQLAMIRLINIHGKIPSPPSKRKQLKARKRKSIPKHLLWRAPAPRARYVAPPILRQWSQQEPNELLRLSETSDIQNALEKWVHTYRRWAPKEQDVNFFTKWLLQAVDGRKYSDVSMERAVMVLKWWLVLLRKYWGGSEYVDELDHLDPSQLDPVGEAWWKAFREVKANMDAIAKERFGGKLSLK